MSQLIQEIIDRPVESYLSQGTVKDCGDRAGEVAVAPLS